MRHVQVSEVLEATGGPNKGKRFINLSIADDEEMDYLATHLEEDDIVDLIAKLKARLIRIDRR